MLRNVIQFEPVRTYIDALVHPSVCADVFAAARHRSFIAVRLLGGCLVLATVPLYFAARGAPGALEGILLAWLISPLAIVWYLSRTANFERAHVLSMASLGGMIVFVASVTGGLSSFAAPWFAVLPLEAILSASRRLILAAVAFTLGSMLILWGAEVAGLLPPSDSGAPWLYLAGVLSAVLYAGAVALGAGALARRGEYIKRAVEARYGLLAENATDVITRHAKNGAVTFISPAVDHMLGAPGSALMCHGFFEHVHVGDRPAFLRALIDATRGRSTSVEYRLRRATRDGEDPSYIWVETRCRALGDGERGEIVAVTRDISRRKLDAEALESARVEAQRANDAKSRFLATVSHELRTPLNAIIGFSEMLTGEAALGLDAARRADYARVIRDSGEHLLALVNSILDVSRIETGHFELKPEPFAVGPLVESCYEMLLLRAEQSGVRFDVEIAPDIPDVVADKLALRQVLINLLSNAIKFTPSGGTVGLSVRRADADLLIVIADTGIGISETDLPQVGNPFFQAHSNYDRPYEGTGLGISVVKGLVELHGGRVEIKSRLGEGTRVLVRLPVASRPAAPAPKRRVVEHLRQRASIVEPEKVKRRA